jgi:hypothetical protein
MPAIPAFVLPTNLQQKNERLGLHVVPSRIHRVGELIRPCNFEFESPLGDVRAGQFKCPKGRIRKVKWVNIGKTSIWHWSMYFCLSPSSVNGLILVILLVPSPPNPFDIPKYSRKFIRRLRFRASV